MCVYFDDVLFGEAEPYARRLDAGFLIAPEVAAVADFHALAGRHKRPNGDDWDSLAILEDAAWKDVVSAAQQAQHRLMLLLSDPAERAALTQPEQWAEEDGIFRAKRSGSAIVRLRN